MSDLVRLNLGCGYDVRPGWLNIDLYQRHGPDVVADVRRLPLPDATFVEIVAIDILEHLEQAETETTLAEWSRVLAPDGVLFLRVPSFPHLAAMALNNTGRDLETDRQVIHFAYGTQAYRGDYHLTSFTPSLGTSR